MATLTADEKTTVRNELEQSGLTPTTYTKEAINAAAQAIETLLTNNAAAISTAINNASQPFGVTFTADQKRLLFAFVCNLKYKRDRNP